jgi:arsenate reductase-like glutaredoxin family protein
MNIQIFGKKKCFDTKKAERYFKERRIKFQKIDLIQKGISPGELRSISQSIGIKNLIDMGSPYYDESGLSDTQNPETVREILLDYTEVLKTPIVRNGKKATVGYNPDVWKTWE